MSVIYNDYIDKYGRVFLKNKRGGVYLTTSIVQDKNSVSSIIKEGIKKKIKRMDYDEYTNFNNEVNAKWTIPVDNANKYNINYYTKELVNNRAEEIIAIVERYLDSENYIILDNNVIFYYVLTPHDNSNWLYFHYFVLNNLQYSDYVYAKGVAPLRIGQMSSISTTVDNADLMENKEWGLCNWAFHDEVIPANIELAVYRYSDNPNLKYIISRLSLFSGFVAYRSNDNRDMADATDISGGMTYENWIKKAPIVDTRPTDREYSQFYSLTRYYGDVNISIAQDDRGGNSSTGGGDGDFDDTSDDIEIPNVPNYSASDTKLVTVFRPTSSQLEAFSSLMWSDWWDSLKKASIFYGDPADIVINMSLVPFNVQMGSTISDLKVAGASTGLSMTKALNQYVYVDCGRIDIKEYWGTFMDYAPYTEMELFLPFCGYCKLDVDEVMNGTVHIQYTVDILTGCCVAYVVVEKTNFNSIIMQMTGNVAYNIPITGTNMSQILKTILNIGAEVATTAVSVVGSTLAASEKTIGHVMASNATKTTATVANAVTDVVSSKPTITRNGNLSANNGMFGYLFPYIIIKRPVQSVPISYPEHYGHLSNITETLSNLRGYTVIESIHLDGVSATQEEKDELEGLLYSGVIL